MPKSTATMFTVFCSFLALATIGHAQMGCHVPDHVDNVRSFVIGKIETTSAVRPACEGALKRLLKSVVNGTSAFDEALLLNSTALAKTCDDDKCPLGELISAAEEALSEVTNEMCGMPPGPGGVPHCPPEDRCCRCHEECFEKYGEDIYAMKKRGGGHGGHHHGGHHGHDGHDGGEEKDLFMGCVRSCDTFCHYHDDDHSYSGPSGPADDHDHDYSGPSGPHDDVHAPSGPAHGDGPSGPPSSSGPSGPADTAGPTTPDWHLRSFACAEDCLYELDIDLATVLGGGLNGCRLLDRAIASTCLEDCSRGVHDLAHQGAEACRADPALLDVKLDAAQGMCVLGCGASLSWDTDACEWLRGDGGACVAGCGGQLAGLRAGALGVCGAGRRLFSADEACDKCHEACRPLMIRADDSHPRCEQACEETVCTGADLWAGDGWTTAGSGSGSGHDDMYGSGSGHDDMYGSGSGHGDMYGSGSDDDMYGSGSGHDDMHHDTYPPSLPGASGPHYYYPPTAAPYHPTGPHGPPTAPHDRLDVALNDLHAALIRAWDIHSVLCLFDDDHHDHHEEGEILEPDDPDDVDTGLCIDHLVHLDAAELCESGCGAKLFTSLDSLLMPFLSMGDAATTSPAAILEASLCSRVEDRAGDHSYCVDLLADVEAATDAERFFAAAPALCLRDEATGARPCLDAASNIAGHFDKLAAGAGHRGRRYLDQLCASAAGAPGDKTRTTVETPVTADDELSEDEEREICDAVAEDVRKHVTDKLGLTDADVSVVVTIKRATAASVRLRRLAAAGGHAYVLSHDILVAGGAAALPSDAELFNECVKPAVAAAAGVAQASTFSSRTVEVPASSFSFDEGQDISQGVEKEEEEKKGNNGFLWGFSKKTVMYGAAGAGVALIALVAAAILVVQRRRRRPRAAARRNSRRLDTDDAGPAALVVVATKIDLYDKA